MVEQPVLPYDREKAVAYARQWAYARNPNYYNFDKNGGDCTNFASQCLYAGTGVMNPKPTYGWYYWSANSRAPAWTSVEYFYRFLLRNKGAGPFGTEVDLTQVQSGDFVQLIINQPDFHHTPVIVQVGEQPSLDNILVAAHSYDTDNKPLSGYAIKAMRFIHIEGFRQAS